MDIDCTSFRPVLAYNFEKLDTELHEQIGADYLGLTHDDRQLVLHLRDDTAGHVQGDALQIVFAHNASDAV